MSNLICVHCEESVTWNRYLEVFFCGNCRVYDEVKVFDILLQEHLV